MNIKQHQLRANLQQGLRQGYLVSGDEFLLVQDCCDLIRSTCKKQGFTERETFQVDASCNWGDILQSANSMSLFADKKLIELRCKTTKIGDDGSKAIQTMLENPNPDIVLLIIMPKLDSAQQKSLWFKAIDLAGITIAVWPIDRATLPRWIQGQLEACGLSASDDALNFLADNVEGNLLAARQEIEKLRIVARTDRIDLATAMEFVSSSSRYTTFNLADRCLAGDMAAALRTLAGLKAEGSDAFIVFWQLTRELRTIYRIQSALQQGMPVSQAMRNERIFDSRQHAMQSAIERLPPRKIEKLLRKARMVDQTIKGINKDSPWLQIEQLIISFCTR